MHPNAERTLAPQGQVDPNGRPRAERLATSGRAEPWTIVRHVHVRGGQYVESRHEAFASHPSHVHTTPTIALLLSGALELRFASGRRLTVDAGEAAGALVLPPGPPHQGRAGAGGARMLFVMPEADRVAMMGTAAAEVLADPAWWRTPRVAMLGRGLLRELAVADDAASLALEGLTLELMSALVRRKGKSAHPGPPPAWLRRVRESLDDRYSERELRIADLAAVAGVDPAHLARRFRAHYGTTAGAYLREIRVQRAADALVRSPAPLARIALDCGFADQSHFTRVFRTVHGVTPLRWRALHGG
ncbi:MAG TPA: AraC family transcriptional regulator [Gemmatimonadaceae bacterium]|jgi:AraC family transcriptional regulator|nr:AraC family transcriptional regulator [Gemmatimonadaceae bacterium]